MQEKESRARRCGVLGHRGEREERGLPLYERVARTGASKQGPRSTSGSESAGLGGRCKGPEQGGTPREMEKWWKCWEREKSRRARGPRMKGETYEASWDFLSWLLRLGRVKQETLGTGSRPGVSLQPSCGGRGKSRAASQEVLAITQERGWGPGVEQSCGEMQSDPRYAEVGEEGLHGQWMWGRKDKSSRVMPRFGV